MNKLVANLAFFPRLIRVACVGLLVTACGSDPEKITDESINMTDPAPVQAGASKEDADDRSFSADGSLIPGNRVELLLDGPDTYDDMFAAIADAKDHINLETFILADDEIGRRLADALAERAAAGVVVNVIYDALGSMSTDDEFFDRMEDDGINLLAFHALLETEPGDWHNRNHRKVLVVDGKVGFTGGLNFTEEYRLSSRTVQTEARFDEGWRDTHLKIRGPAVAAIQTSFLNVWVDTAEEDHVPEANYFPELTAVGDQEVAIVVATGDDELGSTVVDFFVDAVKRAQSRIWLTQAYFAPTDELVDELEIAARRGVDVRVLLPGQSDVDIAELAADAHYEDLLEAGVRIFEYRGGILHAKTAVIDNDWSTVGSSNLDVLSMEFNNELNAVVFDKGFADQMAETFLVDQQDADEITAEEWADRGMWTKLKHGGVKLLQGGE
ncbi:MAG: cardiolipin synthase [Woeseia sp.]|nr:cardiolipin synthase [Woeseia sp.]